MSDSFDERRKALEESYFEKLNTEAIKRIQARTSTSRKSPITGKDMKQETYMGAVIDRCVDSGGVWLDVGELEEIEKNFIAAAGADEGLLTGLLRAFKKRV